MQNATDTQSSNVDPTDPTDSRKQYDWESKYPVAACSKIWWEATYVVVLIGMSLVLILANWRGITADWLSVTGHNADVLRRYCYYSFAGLLGGGVFCLKYLYRMVARGYWHMDRRIWRFTSPLNALALAFVTGALLEASIISLRAPISGSAIVGIGFLVGYFADAAVAKLHEVAEVLFGATLKKQKDQ